MIWDESGDRLSVKEKTAYIRLVDAFVEAYRNKDYSRSDRIRIRLLRGFDTGFDAVEAMRMHDKGVYTFHPFFETVQHRQTRMERRK